MYPSTVHLNCHGNKALKRFLSSSAVAGIQSEDMYKCKHQSPIEKHMPDEGAKSFSKTRGRKSNLTNAKIKESTCNFTRLWWSKVQKWARVNSRCVSSTIIVVWYKNGDITCDKWLFMNTKT